MAPIAGWYDDPQDQSRLRYWDGDAWTEHLIPRPDTAGTPGEPPAPAPEPAQWHFPGGRPAQERSWEYGASYSPVTTQTRRTTGSPQTPDGVRLASWARRTAARLLDLLIVGVGALPFTGYFLYKTLQAEADQRVKPTASWWVPDAAEVKWANSLCAMFLVVFVCYEVFCLSHWGATVGKRALEIKVRLLGDQGRLPWPAIIRRVTFLFSLAFLSLVPVLAFPALLVLLLDWLWPLWDPRRMALHDRVARTVVVDEPRPTVDPRR